MTAGLEEFRQHAAALEWAGLARGAMDAPPALLLHGWLDNAGSFAPLMVKLDGRRLWAPDLPGHGRSAHKPTGSWYHFVDYISDVMALADALGLARFDLIGHSMGGAIATLIAACFPERIGRLVLIEAMGPLSRPAEAAVADLRKAMRARLALTDKQLKLHPDRAQARAARMLANDLSETAAETLIERGLVELPGGWRWSSDPRHTLPTPLRGTQAQYLALLDAITAPTLLILADPPTSYLTGPESEERIHALRPRQLKRLPGGHHLHLENSGEVAAVIGEFLDVGCGERSEPHR